MKISLDWIQEYCELPKDMTAEEIGSRITLATCEVEGVEETNKHFEEIIVVEITGYEAHPEADKLRIVRFETGSGERQVVCGAPNVEVGLKVPFAPVGVTLPIGFTLEPKKIRGIMSEGMLCAEDELGLGEGHEGLLVFPKDAPVGKALSEYLGFTADVILDIDNKSITHRPDLWGHYGMAREFSAVFKSPLSRRFSEEWAASLKSGFTNETSPVTIDVQPGTACLGYMGISVDNIQVKESPSWMQRRLTACGLRPINNIVDISNYVMLELGQPNHMFDRDTIAGGKIIVKDMETETSFTTLDEVERTIIAGDTMVCDADGPSVIGGIMGGLNSSVKPETTRIFIEAANWVDVRIRKTSTRLGLRTDSSQRYEKSLDTNSLERAILRILELLKESCPEATIVGSLESSGMQYTPEKIIELQVDRVNSILGTDLDSNTIGEILTSLDFVIKGSSSESLSVEVPSYRATKDVEVDADLIEEVGRIYGYDKLVPQAPLTAVTAVSLIHEKKITRDIMDFLVYRGRALEIFSYPMVGEKLLKQASWDVMNEGLVLANALNPETDRMRPSLVPSLLEKAAVNQKHYSSSRFFEIGRSYLENDKDFSEDRHQVGIVFTSRNGSPYMDLLNLMIDLLNSLRLKARMTGENTKFPNPLLPADWPGKHPHEYHEINIMGKTAGFITSIHPAMLGSFKIKGQVAMAVIDLTDFMTRAIGNSVKYTPLAKFPGSTFDCTVVAEKRTPVIDVVKVVRSIKMPELTNVQIADIYEPEGDQKMITVRVHFLNREKTLSPEFLSEAEAKVVQALDKAGYPLKK